MHNIDDCLFRTSFNVSIEGDADVGVFEDRMESSFATFVTVTLGAQLISKTPTLWTFSHYEDVTGFASERAESIEWLVNYFLKTLPRVKDKADFPFRSTLSLSGRRTMKLPSWFLHGTFSDLELREAFAQAINEGLISIGYQSIVFKDLCLCLNFELENTTTIYQYTWRSRWVLTLVNFLRNSSKISKRNFRKAAGITRHLRKRLFKKRSLQV